MTDRARAILQLQRAYVSVSKAKENLQRINAKPSITGSAATIEELTSDLIKYILLEYKTQPEPVEE
jgi:hypothetical protein